MERLTDKLLSWASIIEPAALDQAKRASGMPFIFPHLALMPDAHHGKGATVGSVIPTLGAIIPAAVGVDVGCGMIAARTRCTKAEILDHGDLAGLRESIEAAIPASAGNYNLTISSARGTQERIEQLETLDGIDSAEAIAINWRLQLGSLGSGNHFIEVTADEEGRVWLFLHSGSRGVGNRLAVKHIAVAQQVCDRNWVSLPDPDLAYLSEDTPEFWAYLRDLRWAQEFARLNREEMLERTADCLGAWLGGEEIELEEIIQCHHNYTEPLPGELDRHWRSAARVKQFPKIHHHQQIWLSRKGAIDASAGKMGLIPGSMGTSSFIVEGRGNMASLWSAPHGAGRRMSRNAAKNHLTVEELEQEMKGIEWRREAAGILLDEAPRAYKPVAVVMTDAASLVTVKHTLHQLVNVKGD